jgi:hypothetical protein
VNKELIKKYKSEFDHWLNGGSVLMASIDYEDHKYTQFKEINKDHEWSNFQYEQKYIINDEYVEFRKALCEGKVVQYYVDGFTGWQDVATVGNHCIVGAKNYRIKPEEPNFKVGDFVKVTSPSGQTFVSIITAYRDGNQVILDHTAVAYISDCKLWEPEHGELCWFTNNKDSKNAILCKFDSYEKDKIVFKFKNIRKKSFKYCEPFLNSKPSWFKD